jgi:hypothetical protein
VDVPVARDEHVQAAQGSDRFREPSSQLSSIGQIGPDPDSVDRRGRFVRRLGPTEHCDPRACTGERLDDPLPQAAPATGDQSPLPRELERVPRHRDPRYST